MVATSRDHFDYNPFREPIPRREVTPLVKLLDIGNVHDQDYFLSEHNKYGAWIAGEAKKHHDVRLFQLRKVVLRPQPYGMCPTLTANMGVGGHNVPFLLDNGRLRKLTERECLRLQGFPEDFKWPELARGSKYRLPELARGPKYKLIGNAVSPPVARLLADVVMRALEDEKYEHRLAVSA